MVLLIAALSNLTTIRKSNKLPLLEVDNIFANIISLEKNFNDTTGMRIIFDFLYLFLTFQKLRSNQASCDESLKKVLVIQPMQLEQLQARLEVISQSVTKIIRDQKGLDKNTSVRVLLATSENASAYDCPIDVQSKSLQLQMPIVILINFQLNPIIYSTDRSSNYVGLGQ